MKDYLGDTLIPIGMVLEGGGLRGIYTAGVLDCCLDYGIECDAVIGVSAGCAHGGSYISRQRSRSLRVNTDYLRDKRYISLWSLLTTGDMIGAEFVYQTIPDQLDVFDYETFKNSRTRLYATVSNLDTGLAEYIWLNDLPGDMDILRASASLPLISKIVEIKGKKYMDGGVCDSIPIRAAIQLGYEKNIVVLTQPEGFQKRPSREAKLIAWSYRKYPRFVEAARNRHLNYNASLQTIQQEEQAGRAFVFRPSRHLSIKRLEKNRDRVIAMYELGFTDATSRMKALKDWLG